MPSRRTNRRPTPSEQTDHRVTDAPGAGLTADQVAVLQLVSAELAAELDPIRLARLVVEELRGRFGYELPSVYFLQADGKLHLAAQRGYAKPLLELDLHAGVSGRVARTLQPVLIPDVTTDPDFTAGTYGLRSEVCVPILSTGRLLGILSVETRRLGVLDNAAVTLLQLLAQMIAVALNNADLYLAAQRRADEIATIQVLAAEVASVRDLDQLAETVVRELRGRYGYQLVGLYFSIGGSVHLAAAAGYSQDMRTNFDPRTGVVGRVLRTGQAALVVDPAADPDFVAKVDGVIGQVCVPVSASGRVLGALSAETTGPERFGASDLEVLQLLAGHLAVAVENARLFRTAQEENAERARVVAALRDSEARYRHLVEEAQDILYWTDARGRFTYVNPTATRVTGRPPEDLVGRHYLEIVHPEDRFRVARFYTMQARELRPSSYCQFRCLGRDDSVRWIGQNVRVLHENGEIVGFHAIARDITALKEAQAALNSAHEFVDQVIKNAGEGVVVYDRELNYVVWNPVMERLTGLSAPGVLGRSPRELFPEHLERHNIGPVLQRALSGETVRTSDLEFTVRQTGLTGWIAGTYTPHFDGAGHIDGVIGILRDVSERKRAEQALEYQASHDGLTGLLNRARLHQRLEDHVAEVRRTDASLALLVIDLDGFKEVNDVLGHPVGDALLREIAARWRAILPDADDAARLGGDEFAIILPGADAVSARQFTQLLERALEPPLVLDGRVVEIRASVGIALMPGDATDADTLLRYADVAMYQAKRAKAGWAFYRPADDTHGVDRLWMASELREAVERGDLTLHYQPKLRCANGEIVGVEALVRWDHVRLGILSPSEFVPLAEQLGLIGRLTRAVLEEAIRQCHTWRSDGLDMHVTVNISAQDLHDTRLPDVVADLLEFWHVPPANLEIEITESQMMIDPRRSAETLDRLGALGVGIAVDDFGTGYSSLAYLKRLPVSALKIDQSFVRNLLSNERDRVIVRSTIGMAHELGLRVVAEGVEDDRTWQLLRSWRCDEAQGYHLGRAVPADELLSIYGRPARETPVIREAA